MDQARCVEGVVETFTSKPGMGQLLELVVDERQELVEGLLVAFVPPQKHLRMMYCPHKSKTLSTVALGRAHRLL